VLELGSGTGLVGLVAALAGAQQVGRRRSGAQLVMRFVSDGCGILSSRCRALPRVQAGTCCVQQCLERGVSWRPCSSPGVLLLPLSPPPHPGCIDRP
jgi:hypothetical protein